MHLIQRLAAICAICALTACASLPSVGSNEAELASVDIRTEPASCARQLGGNRQASLGALDSNNIQVMVWNIQKGADPQWSTELATSPGMPDLMILQEATLHPEPWQSIGAGHHRAFAPGYRGRRSVTGVMTISGVAPLTQCNLVSVEPLLRTPKATMITEYGLTRTEQTLLVVNVHGVNFAIGMRAFQAQIEQLQSVVTAHPGPVLLSGDFNTWRARRSEVLREAAEDLGLTVPAYADDHRKRVFGRPLDHIYVRGLEVVEATTRRVRSSDHNPMSVRMRL